MWFFSSSLSWWLVKMRKPWGCWKGSLVRSTCCVCGGFGFSSQHPHNVSQSPVTPVARISMYLWPRRSSAHVAHSHAYSHIHTYTHTHKINTLFLNAWVPFLITVNTLLNIEDCVCVWGGSTGKPVFHKATLCCQCGIFFNFVLSSYAYAHAQVIAPSRDQRTTHGHGFSFYHVGPRDWTLVIRFGSRCLYLLSHVPHLWASSQNSVCWGIINFTGSFIWNHLCRSVYKLGRNFQTWSQSSESFPSCQPEAMFVLR